MNETIHKIWGERRRMLLTDKCEIDLLYLKKDSFCSTHKHKSKINKFVVVSGKVRIDTSFGKQELKPKESFTVEPPLVHRFFAIEDSVMVELAYVKKGTINPQDIDRLKQGGRVIDGNYLTKDEMKDKGLLNL